MPTGPATRNTSGPSTRLRWSSSTSRSAGSGEEQRGHPHGGRRLEMCYSRSHIQVYAIAFGTATSRRWVSNLRENGKEVIGIGVKDSSSHLLIDNCDEFIFYEDLLRGQRKTNSRLDDLPPKKKEVFDLMIDAILALEREGKESALGLDGQADDAADEADPQRGLLRLTARLQISWRTPANWASSTSSATIGAGR